MFTFNWGWKQNKYFISKHTPTVYSLTGYLMRKTNRSFVHKMIVAFEKLHLKKSQKNFGRNNFSLQFTAVSQEWLLFISSHYLSQKHSNNIFDCYLYWNVTMAALNRTVSQYNSK